MAYFEANAKYPEAQCLLYVDFPEQYVWVVKSKSWKPHQHNFCIGRLHFASPSFGEWFHMHMLLTVVRGARSFEELRSFQGMVHLTFKAACVAHGLLEDDLEWKLCLKEAAVRGTFLQLPIFLDTP